MKRVCWGRLSLVVGLAALASASWGCNDHPVTPFSDALKAETQDYVGRAGANSVDILWVVDNSGSMCEEQEALKQNFDIFVDELAKTGADFHLAIITTDMEDPTEAGRFQNIPDPVPGPSCNIAIDVAGCPSPDTGSEYPPLIMKSEDYQTPTGELDTERLKLHFSCNATAGTKGTGFEMGLEAVKTSLDLNLRQTYNAGFLRDDAFLAVFFLTDENDCSDRGRIERNNGNACEWYADQLVPVQEYVDFFAQLKNGDTSKIIMGGIIAPDTGLRYSPGQDVTPSCVSTSGTGNGYAGYRYQQLIEAFQNQSTANICNPPFNSALQGLAELITEAVDNTCLTEPPLTCETNDDCASGAACEVRGGGERKFCTTFTVKASIERPSSLGELPGRTCAPVPNTERIRCDLNEGADYTIDYNDTACSTNTAIKLTYTLSSNDSLIVRYPRSVTVGEVTPTVPEGEEGNTEGQ